MTKIYCDIADINLIRKFNKKDLVKGFTTNPSLMRKAGAKDYEKYSKQILKVVNEMYFLLRSKDAKICLTSKIFPVLVHQQLRQEFASCTKQFVIGCAEYKCYFDWLSCSLPAEETNFSTEILRYQ